MASAGAREKKEMNAESLVQWAYQDELSKKFTSSAEGIWNRIEEGRPGQDPGHGAAQRYPHFGLPHPDAEKIEKAVGTLEDLQIDWEVEGEAILGSLIRIADPRSSPVLHRPANSPRPTRVGWHIGQNGHIKRSTVRPPRQTIAVRALRTNALVPMYAKWGIRPDWHDEPPSPSPVYRGSKVAITGECRGKNLYTIGSFCPLEWSPSPLSIAQLRADYLAWWRGLKILSNTLILEDFHVLPPRASEMPWNNVDTEPQDTVHEPIWPRKADRLPLGPTRDITGPPMRAGRAGPVRKVGVSE